MLDALIVLVRTRLPHKAIRIAQTGYQAVSLMDSRALQKELVQLISQMELMMIKKEKFAKI